MSIKVLYAADCELEVITVHKGLDNYTFSQWVDDSTWLRDAFASAGDIDCQHMKVYDVMPEFPTTLEEMQAFDVIVLSDVGVTTLGLLPSFRPPHSVPMGANRLDNLLRYVEAGGGLLMCGGYFSFSGYSGRAAYGDTPVEAALPVLCERGMDDRVEMTQGYAFEITDAGRAHPITKDLGWEEPYLLLGYNRVRAKDGSSVLASYGGDPQIVVSQAGRGRSMAFASDVAPHWAGSFVQWSDYGEFWRRSVRWLAGQD